MVWRKSNILLIYVAFLSGLFVLMFAHAFLKQEANKPFLLEKGEMVKKLELTDLCLFTDARYTRHPSMADLNTAFQDYPMSFDYFPSGSLMAPPSHLRGK